MGFYFACAVLGTTPPTHAQSVTLRRKYKDVYSSECQLLLTTLSSIILRVYSIQKVTLGFALCKKIHSNICMFIPVTNIFTRLLHTADRYPPFPFPFPHSFSLYTQIHKFGFVRASLQSDRPLHSIEETWESRQEEQAYTTYCWTILALIINSLLLGIFVTLTSLLYHAFGYNGAIFI